MLRRTLLAVLLCLSVWAVAQRTLASSPPDVTSAASATPRLSLLPCDTAGSEASWDARHPHSIGASGFSWSTTKLQCVDLPGAARGEGWRSVGRAKASRPLTPVLSPHLHDTPLLI